jgi:N-acetylmuramoyl-L-alanine amidase
MRLFAFAATVCIAFISTAAVAATEGCDEQKQLELLALNMYHEARGEGSIGMQLVGEVTLNRVNRPEFPDTICDVIYQRSQFSWVSGKENHHPRETDVWELALEIADEILREDAQLYDTGATHFLNPDAVRRMPSWARSFEKVAEIGNHVFYEQPQYE